MAKISRAQLEKDLQDYKDSLEASKDLPILLLRTILNIILLPGGWNTACLMI